MVINILLLQYILTIRNTNMHAAFSSSSGSSGFFMISDKKRLDKAGKGFLTIKNYA